MGLTMIVAACWGFAEATLFFVVPDVFLTSVAVRNLHEGLAACAGMLAGALAGGWVMYAWGRADPLRAAAAVAAVPLVNTQMIELVRGRVHVRRWRALVVSGFTGVPYKIFAVVTGSERSRLPLFLIASVPARILRAVPLTLVAAWLGRVPLARWSMAAKETLLVALWFVVYACYVRALRDR